MAATGAGAENLETLVPGPALELDLFTALYTRRAFTMPTMKKQ